jgi:predicted RNase H-like nuclease (RuvC/YqgF family)
MNGQSNKYLELMENIQQRVTEIQSENEDLKKEVEILKSQIGKFERLLYVKDLEFQELLEKNIFLEDYIRYSPDGESVLELFINHFEIVVKMINK